MYANAKYYNDINGNCAGISVEVNGVPSCVPLDPANSDYQRIMALVEAGELVIADAEAAAATSPPAA